MPIGFFTAERKGDIMSRMTGDVGEVEASIMSSLDMVFKNPILIIGYLTFMFYLSWKLTLFVLLSLSQNQGRMLPHQRLIMQDLAAGAGSPVPCCLSAVLHLAAAPLFLKTAASMALNH